ncbi:hypothetical protein [Komagataeibacter oboediens]|uniref:hypothetical protein n=1 Tax=Komagataeibacter oboediens TaxID=65958 RepID=UPI0015E87F39|nr:hypothetical protein [Komagataeibacter oboediens]
MFYEIATHGVISVILFCGFLGMPLLGIVAMILELRRKDDPTAGHRCNDPRAAPKR